MSHLHLKTLTSRTASILATPPGTRFNLAGPLSYSLTDQDGGHTLQKGEVTAAPLFLEGLTPDTGYLLTTDIGELPFRTPPCSGLVDARDHGLSETAEDNHAALAEALDAVPPGGTLMLPSGTFITRPLFLRSDMTLYLPEGCRLKAPSTRKGWPILPPESEDGKLLGTWEGLPESCYAAILTAVGCSNLAITGRGTVDGAGADGDWWSWHKETREGARRARTLFLARCDGVSLSGLTITNSPSWTIHPYHSRNLMAFGLKIINPPDSPNTDGLNPESCENVELCGLHFSVGDDCIAVKSGKRGEIGTVHLAPTQNLAIRHCLMERGHGAVVLGSEMSGDIRNVEIEACEFSETDRGLRIKTRRGRGGVVENVCLTNVSMDRVDTALVVNAFYFCDADGRSEFVQSRIPAPVTDTTPAVRNITLRDVTATNVRLAGAAILGLPESPVTGISIENMSVSFDPAAKPEVPLMADKMEPVRHQLLTKDYAEGDFSGLTLLQEETRAC